MPPAHDDSMLANPPSTALNANREYGLKFFESSFKAAPEGRVLSSVRGLDDLNPPGRSVKSFNEVVRNSSLSPEQKSNLQDVWTQARINGRDIGVDIKTLVPLLETRPDLLDKLHGVATANSLFGISKGSVSERAFEAMRREFLVEVIRGAVDPKILAQGETSTCTACKGLSSTSAANILDLSCSVALNGRAITKGGDEIRLGRDAQDLGRRLIPYAERVSASNLHADGKPTRTVDTVTSRLPSFGMAMVYASLMEMKGGDVTSETGQFCPNYTYMCRSLSGFETACAGNNAKINIDRDGRAVVNAGAGTREVSQIDYLYKSLERIKADTATRSVLDQGSDQGHQRGVLVDLKWADINPEPNGVRRHGRHFLLATGVEKIDGQEFVRLENPIGDYVQGKTSSNGSERYYPPGTKLGDENSIWWKAGENGIVYVRKDVMEKNLVTLMVQYDERYHLSQGNAVRLLGIPEEQRTMREAPIYFVAPSPRLVEASSSKPLYEPKTALLNEEDNYKTIVELAVEQQAGARANKSGAGDEEDTFVRLARGQRKLKEDEVVKLYDEQQDLVVRPKSSDENRFANFSSSASPTSTTTATPPPPPQKPPSV